MDTITKEQRSYVMSKIKSKNTGPERRFGMLLVRNRHRFTKHGDLPGKPDFVLEQFKVAIFIDGCFFHGCRSHWNPPKSNTRFWVDKIRRNRSRDRAANKSLASLGYSVWRFWEHEVRKGGRPRRVLGCLDMLTLAYGRLGQFRAAKLPARRPSDAV